jgi:hypothetical protein
VGLARYHEARVLGDKQRNRDEVRTMLVEIYGWFTDGFDTTDLKEAKALLDKLKRIDGFGSALG